MERIDGHLLYRYYPEYVVFRESFTGDGTTKTFTLDGTIGNATLRGVSWGISSVKTTYLAHVTNTSKKPIYDSLIPLTRHRISVSSINATTGIVTLDYAPRNGVNFYVWYWYALPTHGLLEDYYREDFVASMEEEAAGYSEDVTVTTTNFGGILSGADSTVQKALDTIDDHLHDEQTLQLDSINSDGGAFSFNTTGNVIFNHKISMGTNLISDVVDPVENQDAATKKYVDDGIWMFPPIIEWYDPTGGLPEDPDVGDRYGSDGTAGGWTDGYIYEWDGDEWIESEPEEGWTIWVLFELLFYVFFSGGWMALPGTDHSELDNLAWSVAGHTFDASVDFNSQNLTNVGTIACGIINSTGLALSEVADAGADVDKFLVLDAEDAVDYRTGVEVLSDIGAAASSHTHDTRYLYKENETEFTPDGDYEPATKKYVDDTAASLFELDGNSDIQPKA